ncbi:MAG: S-adenosylmethionine:tRNA ribosyltransferase-isomerase [Anaerolineaceae bacterium]|nr:S-adenosylmethionine:tRNA ribosyltransferase-isomerase [Anaerolineaceae bacterium]
MSAFQAGDPISDFLSNGQPQNLVPLPEFDKRILKAEGTYQEAHQPPELRDLQPLRRDQVRLMVLPRCSGPLIHTHFDALGEYLRPGDVLVVNNSRTLPALLHAQDTEAAHGNQLEVRLARRQSPDTWDALLLEGRKRVGQVGMRLDFGQGLSGQVLGPAPDLPFLWQIRFDPCCMPLVDLIYRLGEPVRYSYVEETYPIDLYQTVYAAEPGSVEMPSAGRPFSWEMLLALQHKGIGLATITLHTSLSSTRDDELDATHPVYAEQFRVPEQTALMINAAHALGQNGRVIAVGTTVVRALETAAQPDGSLLPTSGWTHLHISPGYQLRIVDALLTGLHEPRSSHLDLLSALVEPDRLQMAYHEAIQQGYLWHEFGDVNLII